jgi:hypothetical protein
MMENTMFKLTFQYFNRFDDRVERTVHGETTDHAYSYAYDIALKDGDGEVSTVSLYNMSKVKN